MFKSLQACRGLAALLVVLFHLGLAIASPKYFNIESFGRPFRFGDSGVAFFFVLSGFIITWAHFDDFDKPKRVLRYLRKRALRIYPVYWAVFFAVYLTASASPSLRASVPHDWPTLIKSVLLLPQDPAITGGTGAPVLIVAWSLQYEMCFYALMGAFVVRRPLGYLLCLPLAMNIVGCLLHPCSFPGSFFGNPLILLFGAGVLIAYLRKRSVNLPRPLIIATSAAAAYIGVGVLEAFHGTAVLQVDRMLVYGGLSGCIIFCLVQSEEAGKLRIRHRWITLLGDSSYSLYLVHFPMISLGCKSAMLLGLAGRSGAGVAYAVILAICVSAGLILHKFLEVPSLRALSYSSP